METIVKRRYFHRLQYGKLEKWLEEMGKEGYVLLDYGKLKYVFRKTEKTERKYFVYESFPPRRDEDYYSISLRYPALQKRYGVAPKKSTLNKRYTLNSLMNADYRISFKTIFGGSAKVIVEIDRDKIDDGFCAIVAERNRLYKRRTLKGVLIMALTFALLALAMTLELVGA